MAIPNADKLIAKAGQGVKLNPAERRHCVAYLMATQPDESNVSMGQMFQVSEKMIRNDKLYVREERAKYLREDDVGLIVADISLSFERQIRDIERSKRQAKLGTRTYLQHCTDIFKLEMARVTSLQSLGYVPKNLGTLTTQKFEYSASVSVMGEVKQQEKTAKLEARDNETLDAEFSDITDTGIKLIGPG